MSDDRTNDLYGNAESDGSESDFAGDDGTTGEEQREGAYSWKRHFEQAKEAYRQYGGWADFKNGRWLPRLVEKAFMNFWKRANSEYFHQKYPNLHTDEIATRLVAVAAKNAAAIGGMAGAAVSTDEIVALLTAGEGGIGLPANIGVAGAAIGAEVIALVCIWLKLIAELGKLYDAPLDREDPEDIWIIIGYALGGNSAAHVGDFLRTAAGQASGQFTKKVFSKQRRKAIQWFFAEFLGKKILKKTIVNTAVPIVSIGVGSAWNWWATRRVGRLAIKHFKVGAPQAPHPDGAPVEPFPESPLAAMAAV